MEDGKGWNDGRARDAPHSRARPLSLPAPHFASSTLSLSAYAKSSRAKCHGSFPTCTGLPIARGELRYGAYVHNPFGNRYSDSEMVQWYHWGCLPKTILDKVANAGVVNVEGFGTLKYSPLTNIHSTYLSMVRTALANRKIDPADYPSNTASLVPAAPSQGAGPSSSQTAASASTTKSRKRKAEDLDLLSSQPSSSQSGGMSTMPSQATELRRDGEVEDNNEDADEVYIAMNSQVVGIQYYHGLVGSGEQVLLVREPNNKYDANAIQVLNIQRIQVGHIPRNVASRLAPVMDQGLVTVEGTMVQGNLSGAHAYTLSLKLQICGPADPVRRSQIEPYLVWATPGQRGFDQARTGSATPSQLLPSSTQAQRDALSLSQDQAEDLQRILEGFKKANDEGRRDSLLDSLCAEQDILKAPEHRNPPSKASGDLFTDLLKHQSQALQWCIDREHPEQHLAKKETDPPVQFWQLKKTGKQVLATQTPQAEKPLLGKGGIVADAMGLGKTLTMLSLILATKDEAISGFSNTTLIVVPLSVLSNWEEQIAEHITRGKLSMHIYHGGGRDVSETQLKKFDIVITTYQTVVSEMDKTNGGTGPSRKKRNAKHHFLISSGRIILDEGHTVRNPRALMSQAICSLEADRRWIVTGTPIDLGSLLAFLRICRPLDQADFFKRLLVRPFAQGSPTAVDLLKALMNSICIRRTKEMQDENGKPLVPVPPVEMIVVRVTLDDETRKVYDAIEAESRRRFDESLAMNSGDAVAAPASVLSMLTRLRQLALHPALVPPNYLEVVSRAVEDSEECPIIPYVRFDGSMSAKKRKEVLANFTQPAASNDDSSETEYEDDTPAKPNKGKGIFGSRVAQRPLVMLISLKAGALGLNLTVANNVFLESIESQAIDRVNRIGQKRKVTVYQLIADDTVESKVLEIQGRKTEFIKQAFSGMKARENSRTRKETRLNELIELFGGQPQRRK
ncbi:hypothetical protein DACRYDRAFT_87309 [Dacryopinax primogenitus]|uniref:Uncharacterized protein n=1 Tax=Dacryopinax primogenitus (strain DJM 731) TaxID=1858805 RepID=M5G136_DACPD|nr:uncharacterized protein DACRYDRAFT_87309 [Dacryopinax primogenitus]EJU03956.1 hypothetical protein DACRYDRAFT_87309 [Dacryopinax primogenitus]